MVDIAVEQVQRIARELMGDPREPPGGEQRIAEIPDGVEAGYLRVGHRHSQQQHQRADGDDFKGGDVHCPDRREIVVFGQPRIARQEAGTGPAEKPLNPPGQVLAPKREMPGRQDNRHPKGESQRRRHLYADSGEVEDGAPACGKRPHEQCHQDEAEDVGGGHPPGARCGSRLVAHLERERARAHNSAVPETYSARV